MSVIMVTPDSFETISKTVAHLRNQTVKEQLEIVFVAPNADIINLKNPLLDCFYKLCMVEVGEITSTGKAIAAGVRKANAPIVTYAEEHSFPDTYWAEALIEAHQQPWAAVGAVVANANPYYIVSWAAIFSDFGPWLEPAEKRECSSLPTHQTSYKRNILLDYGPELEDMLEVETLLHWDLHAKGYKLYFEPSAKVHHLNISRLSSYIGAQFHGGRLFGAARVWHEKWSKWLRLIYIVGIPMIPIIRLWRILKEIRCKFRQNELLPRVIPPLIIGLISHSIGELIAYISGVGDASKKIITYELNRTLHIGEQDREYRMKI